MHEMLSSYKYGLQEYHSKTGVFMMTICAVRM